MYLNQMIYFHSALIDYLVRSTHSTAVAVEMSLNFGFAVLVFARGDFVGLQLMHLAQEFLKQYVV